MCVCCVCVWVHVRVGAPAPVFVFLCVHVCNIPSWARGVTAFICSVQADGGRVGSPRSCPRFPCTCICSWAVSWVAEGHSPSPSISSSCCAIPSCVGQQGGLTDHLVLLYMTAFVSAIRGTKMRFSFSLPSSYTSFPFMQL